MAKKSKENAGAIYYDNDGASYEAEIERVYEDVETIKLGGGKYRNQVSQYADLRVNFGRTKTIVNERGVPEEVPELKPVFGVAPKGQGSGRHGRCFVPADASPDQLQAMDDACKSREQLLAELDSLRDGPKKRTKKVKEVEAPEGEEQPPALDD